jgi:hypothetical protein
LGCFEKDFAPATSLRPLQIHGLRTPRVRLSVEPDALTVRERVHAGRLDRRDVDEDILGSTFRGKKPKPFCVLKNLTVPVAMFAPNAVLFRERNALAALRYNVGFGSLAVSARRALKQV